MSSASLYGLAERECLQAARVLKWTALSRTSIIHATSGHDFGDLAAVLLLSFVTPTYPKTQDEDSP